MGILYGCGVGIWVIGWSETRRLDLKMLSLGLDGADGPLPGLYMLLGCLDV